MSLRARLAAAFVGVVLLPIVIAALVVSLFVPRVLERQAGSQLEAGRAAAATVLEGRCRRVSLAAEVLGRQAATDPAAAVADVHTRGLVSGAAVLDRSGRVIASAGTLGAETAPELAAATACGATSSVAAPHRWFVGTASFGGSTRLGRAVAVLDVDRNFALDVGRATSSGVTFIADGKVLATSLPSSTDMRPVVAAAEQLAARPAGSLDRVGDQQLAVLSPEPGRPLTVVLSQPVPPSVDALRNVVLLALLAVILVAPFLGRRLARLTTQPLTELSEAADRVRQGELNTPIQVRSDDEVGRLAGSIKGMIGELQANVRELEMNRDELRRNLHRLGETLSSTHDLDRILEVILETSLVSVKADAGVVWLPGRGGLFAKVTRGLDGVAPMRLQRGEGISGHVAATGEAICWRDVAACTNGSAVADGSAFAHGSGASGANTGVAVIPSAAEPPARHVLSVPLVSSGRTVGVLTLYGRDGFAGFRDDDVDTIRSFAGQATVAIDNVLLHQEAQRLSITDGLTGLWNYRYFAMNVGKEIERAARFGRPLSVLLLDLDHFKSVNDVHGHQRGDSVLIELATRVKGAIREVDTLARYGGEEFVLLLPETDRDGAAITAERICSVVRDTPFGSGAETPLPITLSVGVAVFPVHGTTSTELVRQADAALYAVKAGGRDGWRLAGDPTDALSTTPGRQGAQAEA